MIRSLFFAPANRPDLLAKFPRFPADCYVIDLEDGTPPADKARARATLAESVAGLRAAKLAGLLAIRVNEPASEHYLSDLAAAFATDADAVVIPKLEQREQLFPALHGAEHRDRAAPRAQPRALIGGLESIHGVVNALALCAAHPRLTAVYFGAEDFSSEMGGRRTPDGEEVFHARSQVVLAAKAARVTAIDQAVLDIRDDALFRRDAERGRNLGYEGKICVLPRQVAIANAAFSPSAEEIDHSRRLIAAYERATAAGIGTIDFEGKMIDGPLLKRAQQVVAVAARIEARGAA